MNPGDVVELQSRGTEAYYQGEEPALKGKRRVRVLVPLIVWADDVKPVKEPK